MRKIAGIVLVFIGGLAIVVAAVAAFWTSDQVKKTPLDTDSTTRLEGTASLSGAASVPIKAVSYTRADSARSTSDVIVFNSSTCLVIIEGDTPDCVEADDPQGRLLSASTEIFGADRTTGQAVNDPKILPPDAVDKEGLVNKFPFDAEKKDYGMWDGLTSSVVQAVYSGEEKIEGLNTYRYVVTIKDAPIQIAEGVPGTYSDNKTMWADPRTGSIVKQVEQQSRIAADGSPVLALDYAFTDEQVSQSVQEAKDNIKLLDLVSTTVPIVGVLLGILALAVGLLLQRGRRESSGAHQ